MQAHMIFPILPYSTTPKHFELDDEFALDLIVEGKFIQAFER